MLEDYSGCKFKDHDVCTKETRDASITTMLESYRNVIEEMPPELMFPERLTRLVAKGSFFLYFIFAVRVHSQLKKTNFSIIYCLPK